jgi:hypothetical protein
MYNLRLSPLQKHLKYDNQPFFWLRHKGIHLIINKVETNIFNTLRLEDFM